MHRHRTGDRHAIADRLGNREEFAVYDQVLRRLTELCGSPFGGWPQVVTAFRTDTYPSPTGEGPDTRCEIGWLKVTGPDGEVVDPAELVEAARDAVRARRLAARPAGRFRDGTWPLRRRRRRRHPTRRVAGYGRRLRWDATLDPDVAEGYPRAAGKRSKPTVDTFDEGAPRRSQRCWKEQRRTRWS